jgi:hypothetical protein
MKRPAKNFIIDAVAFAGFVLLTTTGVLMRYVLPPGSGRFKVIWGLDRHGWGNIHFWISTVFLGILAIHLIFHWGWIVNVFTGKPREGSGFRVGLGIVGLVGLLALAIAPLVSQVETTAKRNIDRNIPSPHEYENVQIQGTMTLNDVEQNTGVPAEYIIRHLNLPIDVERGDRLGQLKRIFRFTIEDVRHIVRDYKKEE